MVTVASVDGWLGLHSLGVRTRLCNRLVLKTSPAKSGGDWVAERRLFLYVAVTQLTVGDTLARGYTRPT